MHHWKTVLGCTMLALSACSETPLPTNLDPDVTPSAAVITLSDAELLRAQIEQLTAEGVLNTGQARSLLAKVEAAANQIEAGNPGAADRIMGALAQEVRVLVAAGILTGEQGTWLLLLAAGGTDLAGTYDYAAFNALPNVPEYQYAVGVLTLWWVDREAGTFAGELLRRILTPDGQFITPVQTLVVRDGTLNSDRTFYFEADVVGFGGQVIAIPHAGEFDGTTLAGPVQNVSNLRFVATRQ